MIINILTSGHLMAPYRKVKCHMSDVTVEGRAGRRAENWLRLVWGLLLLSCGGCFHCPQPRPLVAQMKVCMSILVYKFSNGTLIVSIPACWASKQVPECLSLRDLNSASFQMCSLYNLVALSWRASSLSDSHLRVLLSCSRLSLGSSLRLSH